MNKIILLLGIIFAALNFSGCPPQPTSTQTQSSLTQITQTTMQPAGKGPLKIEVNFPNITKNQLAPGTITIDNNNAQQIRDIKITGLPSNIFEYANAPRQNKIKIGSGAYPGGVGVGFRGAVCPANGTLQAHSFCEISLVAEPGNTPRGVAEEIRKDKIILSYTYDNKHYEEPLELTSKIIDRKEIYVSSPKFNDNLALNNKYDPIKNYELYLTNMSNVDEVTNVQITPPVGSVFTLGYYPTDIQPKSKKVEVKLSYTPKIAGPAVSETWDLSYDMGTEHKTIQFTVSAPATTAPGALVISNNDFGKKTTVLPDGKFKISLIIDNPKNGTAATGLDLSAKNKDWEELTLDPNSTCVTKPQLNIKESCQYFLTLKPIASDPNYNKKLILSYNSASGNEQIEFDIKGDITALPPGTVIDVFPVEIQAHNTLSDPYWPYIKRPTLTDAENLKLYPQDVLDRIPKDTRQSHKTGNPKDYFVPWAFKNAWFPPPDKTELRTIVPDRIEDITGKEYIDSDGNKYIKLYHGTTAKFKNDFLTTGIAFDKGFRMAYGQGFYLTSDINEAKNYACYTAGGSGHHALLLVVGIKDIDKIKGNKGDQFFHYSNHKGELKNPSLGIYFSTGHINQFVFYKNSAPYMKLFYVVDLPPKFGKSVDLSEENDGYSTTDTTPDGMFGGFTCPY